MTITSLPLRAGRRGRRPLQVRWGSFLFYPTMVVIVGLFLRGANGVRPYIMPLYLSACVACYMTAHVYRYRQACNVGRGLFDVYGKTGLRAAKALRSYA